MPGACAIGMAEPAQKPGRSKQDYGTPIEFIDTVQRRFGELSWDLACTRANCVAHRGIMFDGGVDSLTQDWTLLEGNLWLNPPFGDIPRWAAKCKASAGKGRRIIMLTPASIGTNWFAEHVHGSALVLGLNPRLTFAGEKAPYPKDLMLSVWGDEVGFNVWRWKHMPRSEAA